MESKIQYLAEKLSNEMLDVAKWVYKGKSISYEQPILLSDGSEFRLIVKRIFDA